MTEAVLDEQWTDGRFARYFNTGSPSGLGLNTPVVNSIIGKFNRGDRTHVAKLGDRRLKPGDEVITVAAGFRARSIRLSKII